MPTKAARVALSRIAWKVRPRGDLVMRYMRKTAATVTARTK
jgi:hypothetical protein